MLKFGLCIFLPEAEEYIPETHIQAIKSVRECIAHASLLTQDEYARHAKQILVQQA